MLIGILHPGAMGSGVAACLRSAGHSVLWASKGRSEATRKRATEHGIEEVGSLDDLFARAETVLSICPPANARELAHAAIEADFQGVYVDCNAISPSSARAIAGACSAAGLRFVDAGIIGPPPKTAGSTRLYLAGEEASSVGRLCEGGPLDAVVLDGPVGAASALKMAYAAWTKGSAALLLAIRALAVREGVEEALLHEWDLSAGELGRISTASRFTAPKAWRFVAEMDEVAQTFARAGLPAGFHESAARIYERMAAFKDSGKPVELEEILDRILASP